MTQLASASCASIPRLGGLDINLHCQFKPSYGNTDSALLLQLTAATASPFCENQANLHARIKTIAPGHNEMHRDTHLCSFLADIAAPSSRPLLRLLRARWSRHSGRIPYTFRTLTGTSVGVAALLSRYVGYTFASFESTAAPLLPTARLYPS